MNRERIFLQVEGDSIVFINLLVYASAPTSPIRYFSDVVLSHSCTYSMKAYREYVSYAVVSDSFSFPVENEKSVDFDIRYEVISLSLAIGIIMDL